MPATIIKRDGSQVPFDSVKILNAISKANQAVGEEEMSPTDLLFVTEKVCKKLDLLGLQNVEEIQEELFNQTFGPVKWVEIINKLAENGVTKIYEIGPGSILKGMIKKINGDIEVINVSKIDDLANL